MSSFPKTNFPCKVFVKQGHTNEETACTQKVNLHIEPCSGDTAREFYESIINEDPTCTRKSIIKRNNTKSSSHFHKETLTPKSNYSAKDLFKLAQNNEFNAISRLIRDYKTIDINATDNFGWTPLMCAACNGSKESVEILLQNKADPNKCDKFGNNALKLAKKNKFFHIVAILEKPSTNIPMNVERKRKHTEKVFCQICNIFHTDISHESSTLHLFNSNQPKSFYGIPESNKGFQMLLRSGWNREKGLGLTECGIQFPIKVKKKTDRCGIGRKTSKKLFDVTDRNQIRTKFDISHKKNDKYFERKFRLEFT